ncbi:MAG: TolC family protein, partial [Arcobacter sp.]
MKKIYYIFLTPLFLYGQNLEELVDLSIQNRLINASEQNLESVKDEYKSVKSGYLPSLDLGGKYGIAEKETQSLAKKAGSVNASLNYTLYDGGKNPNVYDSYESTIKSGEESLESLKYVIS